MFPPVLHAFDPGLLRLPPLVPAQIQPLQRPALEIVFLITFFVEIEEVCEVLEVRGVLEEVAGEGQGREGAAAGGQVVRGEQVGEGAVQQVVRGEVQGSQGGQSREDGEQGLETLKV